MRAARAVAMSTNLCERWVSCCSQEMHFIDYNVPPIVFALFLKCQEKGVMEKQVFLERFLKI